jgi:transposase
MNEQTLPNTYKYKLKPSPEQERALEFVLRRCCELYNAGLVERRDAWQKSSVSVTEAMQSAQLPDIKEVRPEYGDIHSQVLQDVLTRLDRACQEWRDTWLSTLSGEQALQRPHQQAIRQRSHTGQRLPGPVQDRAACGSLVPSA